MNQVSYVNPKTPLKIADFYNISGVFHVNSLKDTPPSFPPTLGVSVLGFTLHDYVEIIFQNNEYTIQSWHLDGSDFWTVGKRFYNLNDATTRHTVQVYPKSWSAILVSLDNKDMWNLRSTIWPETIPGTGAVCSCLE
ncbi:putative L-ascorbate oxidase [Helianthus debilis subsp. tardiflorus]